MKQAKVFKYLSIISFSIYFNVLRRVICPEFRRFWIISLLRTRYGYQYSKYRMFFFLKLMTLGISFNGNIIDVVKV